MGGWHHGSEEKLTFHPSNLPYRRTIVEIRKIVLIHPGREGRIFGKATAVPYTLMRLASLVPADIDVEIWDENWEYLDHKIRSLGKHDLVGITSKTLAIECKAFREERWPAAAA